MPDGSDRSTQRPAEVLRLLERAVAVARRRRRFQRGLVLVALALLGAFVVLGVMLVVGG